MSDNISPGTGIPLATLSESGSVPTTRLKDAAQVMELVRILIDANDTRNKTEAKVAGLVDGNPPYKTADLKNAGQPWRPNANFREAEAFTDTGKNAFYDILTEAPTYATVELDAGRPEDSSRASKVATEAFDWLNKRDRRLDRMFQLSHREMTLFGLGPVVWENELDFHSRAIWKRHLLVPDGTETQLDDWEVAVVLVDYKPHQLYGCIANASVAKSAGWHVETVKNELIAAAPKTENQEGNPDWQFLQQQIRANDLCYSARSKVISVAHVFYREFPKDKELEGKISHCIVSAKRSGTGAPNGFLYQKLDQYDHWNQVINPFYYDVGDGTHHSVKGIGIKFYSALDLKNRLDNDAIMVAFERVKMPVQVQTAEAVQTFQVVSSGPYTLYPPGTAPLPIPVGGDLMAPQMLSRQLLSTVSSNLSQYRQNLQRERGNPITAAEVQQRTEQQSLLGKTQLNRYYEQLDAFWAERYRRLVNPKLTEINPGGKEAAEFIKRCKDNGVPIEVLRKVKSVKATRVAGQGSPFLRQASLDVLMQSAGMLGADGRMALLEEWIASRVGQNMVDRFLPASDRARVANHDTWEAAMEHVAMRLGHPAPVVGSQNHVIHLEAHLNAGAQAMQSLEQGADPKDVLAFADQVGPHNAAHLEELAQDPTRQREYKLLKEQFDEFGAVTDKLRDAVAEQGEEQQAAMAAQQQAQAIASGTDPDQQIKAATAMADSQRKDRMAMADMRRKNIKTRTDLALKDMKTASGIRLANRKQAAQTEMAANKERGNEE